MDAKIGKFFDSVGSFFSGGDKIPWSDGDVIAGCEREVREATDTGSEELKKECLMRLSWALVHSHQNEDVQRGIAMLEASLANSAPPLEDREKLYLLAVGYYRSGDYSKSRQLVDSCMEMQPDWRQALVLKKTIEDKITKDGVIGIGIMASAVGAVGLIAGGIVAALDPQTQNTSLQRLQNVERRVVRVLVIAGGVMEELASPSGPKKEFVNSHCREFMQSMKDIQVTLREEIKSACEYRPFEKCDYNARIASEICFQKLEYVLTQLDDLKQTADRYPSSG